MPAQRVACIIPVFCGERYLAETIASLRAQTHPDLEIIVADDGSTDATRELALRAGSSVRYAWQPNAGPAAARNLGLRLCAADWVAFLDADDLWHPERLERQLSRFAARPELALSFTYIQNFIDADGVLLATPDLEARLLGPVPGLGMSTLLARRAVFDQIGSFDPTIQHGSGLEWVLRAREHGLAEELWPEVLVYRRLHPENRSRRRAQASRDEHLRVLKAALDRRRGLKRLRTADRAG
jgi:glycosyltransferase involved in cell wall biosynthesis